MTEACSTLDPYLLEANGIYLAGEDWTAALASESPRYSRSRLLSQPLYSTGPDLA